MYFITNVYQYGVSHKIPKWYSPTRTWLYWLTKYDDLYYAKKLDNLITNELDKILQIAVDHDSIAILQFLLKCRTKYTRLIVSIIIKTTKLYLLDRLIIGDIYYDLKGEWSISPILLDQLNNCQHTFYNCHGLWRAVAEKDDVTFIDYLKNTDKKTNLVIYLIDFGANLILDQLLSEGFKVSSPKIISLVVNLNIDQIPLLMKFYKFPPYISYIIRWSNLDIFKLLEQYPFDFQNHIEDLVITTDEMADYIFDNYNTSVLIAKPFIYLTFPIIKKIIYYKEWGEEDQSSLYRFVRYKKTDIFIFLIEHFGPSLIVDQNYRVVAEALIYNNWDAVKYLLKFEAIIDKAVDVMIKYKNILALEKYLWVAEWNSNYQHINKIIKCVNLNYNLMSSTKKKCSELLIQ